MRSEMVPVFDGHNDTLLKLELAEREGKTGDFFDDASRSDITYARAQLGGFGGGLFAMFTPSHIEPGARWNPSDPRNSQSVDQPDALLFTLDLFARARRIERQSNGSVRIVGSAGEIERALADNVMALVPHIEGAECIDENFAALEVLYAAGLRSLGLVWSRPNKFGHGAPMELQTEPDPGEGLTEAGLELVRACEALGVLVDLSHLTMAGFWDAAKIASRPLVASHSNAHALSPSARNLTDRQLAAIGESNGLVGLNFHVAFAREDCRHVRDTPLDVYIRHLEYLIGFLGENGVAIGSDFDGCILPEALSDVSKLQALIAAMRDAEFGEDLIAKICWKNWVRMLDQGESRQSEPTPDLMLAGD